MCYGEGMTTATANRTAIAYLRVSTELQNESGLGLEAQLATITDYANRHGIEITETVTEVQSGKSLRHRPLLTATLERMAKGAAELIITANVSRLARNVSDLAGMLDLSDRAGFGIIAIDANLDSSTPSGRMIVQMLGVAAEFERAMVSDRTKKALAAAKARGVVLGRPAELEDAVRNIIRAKRTEGMSLKAIATDLNAKGIATPRGAQWSEANVQQVLARTGGDPRPGKVGRPRKAAA